MAVRETTTRRVMTAPVTRKGQVTIPVEIRRRLGIKTPDRVQFVVDDDGGVRLEVTRSIIRGLAGSIKAIPGREHLDYEDVRHEMLEDLADQIVRDMGGL